MAEAEPAPAEPPNRLIIAFDFGTTFSSVAYALVSDETPRDTVDITDVRCIARYPDDRPQPGVTFGWEPREDVPTELWYSLPLTSKHKQSGHQSMQISEEESMNGDSTMSDASSEFSCSFPDDTDNLEDEEENTGANGGRSDPLFWGFGVQKQLKHIDIPKDGTRRITRFKLMLDEKSEETEDIRAELFPILKNLKRSKMIKHNTDVINDYLEQLFRHTKDELRRLTLYNVNTPIEFVLCVPAVWPSKACRAMQAAMSAAAKGSELGSLVNGGIDNLFIISEPEAAAACVLAEDNNDIYENETIVILDAGGGTVDAVTYKVTKSYPLRLSDQVVPPGSKACGASYINERFEKLLLKRLKHEKYLIKNGKTIKSIVEGKVIEFENGEKRLIDTTNENFETEPIYIDDLRANSAKRFYQNRLGISKREMMWVFQESLDKTADLLIAQLEMVKAKGSAVQKVILIGGFGQSPSLQAHLRNVLATEKNFLGQEISLLIPRTASTAVARGAVLQALNKDHNSLRITSCSYGFLQTEPYEPEEFAAHRNTRCIIDKADGEKYIDGTINWLIQKDESLPAHHEFSIIVKHTFAPKRTVFKCKEVLYVSDFQHESHYRATHAINKGAEIAGSITADMTFLKDEGLIQLTPPSVFSTYSGPKAPLHWEVTFELVMIIDGRNLRYEARWPPSNSPEASLYSQRVQEKGQICIAAAFKPGTA
ncbi:hypothetical protein L207DRAFT_549324 [Hyaloscypha variabilis F]|uniref:Actin-like ATPase domain-containing protein n=1 Tax=Hyaloscypha variabilis (strain UAMH 11265 / GT02V1 / F) TaxID=1149755 RepID=A0A2J6QWH6_HYAVF|nr:hypothetical protein L207DRAFT_549324 [Hyaloscypha variabilis F]